MTFDDWTSGRRLAWKEIDWARSSEPNLMLQFLGKEAPERKRCLFAVACCYRIWDVITTELHRNAIEVAEGYADGVVDEADAENTRRLLREDYDRSWGSLSLMDPLEALRNSRDDTVSFQETVTWTLRKRWDMPWVVSRNAAVLRAGRDEGFDLEHKIGNAASMTEAQRQLANESWKRRELNERIVQSDLIRDMFGNPFRDCRISEKDIPTSIREFAETIYVERRFDLMPNLGEKVLQIHGSVDIVEHC